jgi:hypothetical protein
LFLRNQYLKVKSIYRLRGVLAQKCTKGEFLEEGKIGGGGAGDFLDFMTTTKINVTKQFTRYVVPFQSCMMHGQFL